MSTGDPSRLQTAIGNLEQALQFEYRGNTEIQKALNILYKIDNVSIYDNLIAITSIEGIASRYHDRECCAMQGGGDKVCPICFKPCSSLICIEPDSLKFEDDLWICMDCYTQIHKVWMEKKPGKICPV